MIVYTPATAFFATEIPLVFLPQQQLLGLQSSDPAMEITPFASVTFALLLSTTVFVPKLNIIFKFFANSLVPV
jgi:hypothetical protein